MPDIPKGIPISLVKAFKKDIVIVLTYSSSDNTLATASAGSSSEAKLIAASWAEAIMQLICSVAMPENWHEHYKETELMKKDVLIAHLEDRVKKLEYVCVTLERREEDRLKNSQRIIRID